MIKFLFIMSCVLLIGCVIGGALELFSLHDRMAELENEVEKLKKDKKLGDVL